MGHEFSKRTKDFQRELISDFISYFDDVDMEAFKNEYGEIGKVPEDDLSNLYSRCKRTLEWSKSHKLHSLKCWEEFMPFIEDLSKPFEIRKNDRNYKVGDILQINPVTKEKNRKAGNSVFRIITYITDFEQKEGFVVLGIKPFERKLTPTP